MLSHTHWKRLMLLIGVYQVYRGKKSQLDSKSCTLNTKYKNANTECVGLCGCLANSTAKKNLGFIKLCLYSDYYYTKFKRNSWKSKRLFHQCPSGNSQQIIEIFEIKKILHIPQVTAASTRKINIKSISSQQASITQTATVEDSRCWSDPSLEKLLQLIRLHLTFFLLTIQFKSKFVCASDFDIFALTDPQIRNTT